MRDTRLIMGMPVTVDIGDSSAADITAIFEYFAAVDERFSTYKEGSEISRINRGEIAPADYSGAMREVFELAEKTKRETNGYFDMTRPDGSLDPSGIVKGWAIRDAARLLAGRGFSNFFIDAGGDVQSSGTNAEGESWSVGIRNPFKADEIVKVLYPNGAGIATSGTYIRGQHIYDPHAPGTPLEDVVSLTVIGPDVLEADRYATAAFAMGKRGIEFIEGLSGFEAYEIDRNGMARATSGFSHYTHP